MGNRGTEGNQAAAALDGCHQGTDPFVRALENNKGELVCTTVSFQSRRFLSGRKASSQGKEKVQRLLKAASKEKCSDAMLDIFFPSLHAQPCSLWVILNIKGCKWLKYRTEAGSTVSPQWGDPSLANPVCSGPEKYCIWFHVKNGQTFPECLASEKCETQRPNVHHLQESNDRQWEWWLKKFKYIGYRFKSYSHISCSWIGH